MGVTGAGGQARHTLQARGQGGSTKHPPQKEHDAKVISVCAKKHLTSSLLGREPVSGWGLPRANWLEEPQEKS